MIKLIKKYFKYKTLSLLKDKQLYYSNKKEEYINRMYFWKNKQKTTEDQKENSNRIKEQISWSHEKHVEYLNKEKAIKDVIQIIESENFI